MKMLRCAPLGDVVQSHVATAFLRLICTTNSRNLRDERQRIIAATHAFVSRSFSHPFIEPKHHPTTRKTCRRKLAPIVVRISRLPVHTFLLLLSREESGRQTQTFNRKESKVQ